MWAINYSFYLNFYDYWGINTYPKIQFVCDNTTSLFINNTNTYSALGINSIDLFKEFNDMMESQHLLETLNINFFEHLIGWTIKNNIETCVFIILFINAVLI